MAYLFHQDELPRLLSVTSGRERVFFVNKELAHMDDMVAGVTYYQQDVSSPLHLHENCEHFYLILDGAATFESDEGTVELGPGDLVFIPPEEKHRLSARTPLHYFEFQAPNRFKTRILDGAQGNLLWERVDGSVRARS